jgi:membrane-bound lytic murein transglycosylase F
LNPNRISAYDPIIKKMARRYGFDWRLIAAQIYTESNFNSDVKSGVGALGLMQVMPSTARIIGVPPEKMQLPHINIAVGCLYNQRMYYLWKRETNKTDQRLAFAFASYNAGRGRVLRSYDTRKNLTTWETVHRGLPAETQMYVHKIFLKYEVYRKNILP